MAKNSGGMGSKGGSAKPHVAPSRTSGKPGGASAPKVGGVMNGKPGGKGTPGRSQTPH